MAVGGRGGLAGARGLLLLGLVMISCDTKSPPEEEEILPRLEALREGAWLLTVDVRQRFMVFSATDGSGTFAQALPDGEATRISDAAAGASLASDSESVLLWGPLALDQTRTWWFWRPGLDTAIPIAERTRDVVHDRALSYLAFPEYDAAANTTALRVLDMAPCTARDCPSRTLLQVPGASLSLQARGSTVIAYDATQAWLVDVTSGAVSPLGSMAGPPSLFSDGGRYGWFDVAGRLQVLDAGTRAVQWERSWAEEVSRQGWSVTSAALLDSMAIVFNILEPAPPPPAFPTRRESVRCDAAGCVLIPGGAGNCWYGLGRTDLVRCVRNPWCSPYPYGCPWQDTYFNGADELLANMTYSGHESPVPAFSADLSQRVLSSSSSTSDQLEWVRFPDDVRAVTVPGAVDTRLLAFLPGDSRVVFTQALTGSDDVRRIHLSAWDGASLTDLLTLPGRPTPLAGGSPLVRDHPLALYVTVEVPGPPYAYRILRIRL
jgi:hypothetical protein